MATRKSQAAESSAKSTAMTVWDKELAEAARASAALAAEQTSGGAKNISIRGGVMTVDGNQVPGNTLVGVVVGFTLCNKYYTEEFDPDSPASPACYAYGQRAADMGPHDEAEDPQADACKGCLQNEFGTADKGRGKACKNTYQLLVLPAGTYDFREDRFDPPETADELGGDLHGLSVSPTNLKAWAGYVDRLAGNLRPEWACYTKITATPDAKQQVKLTFALVKNVDTSLLTILRTRHEEALKVIEQPFPKNSERVERDAAPPKKRKVTSERQKRNF